MLSHIIITHTNISVSGWEMPGGGKQESITSLLVFCIQPTPTGPAQRSTLRKEVGSPTRTEEQILVCFPTPRVNNCCRLKLDMVRKDVSIIYMFETERTTKRTSPQESKERHNCDKEGKDD
uniref:Uncharacterized protein n=1 Tax=Pseudictyota dubia TaxID=2749911 RepID=A0A7R9VHU0_9STRA|mmetsp:Transcript_13705/g.25727  ORF Transcript_13705/g.25727 Transcript_13705/m.25727 type:complete len:121 (+) Transcript_13705:157-519(+)